MEEFPAEPHSNLYIIWNHRSNRDKKREGEGAFLCVWSLSVQHMKSQEAVTI